MHFYSNTPAPSPVRRAAMPGRSGRWRPGTEKRPGRAERHTILWRKAVGGILLPVLAPFRLIFSLYFVAGEQVERLLPENPCRHGETEVGPGRRHGNAATGSPAQQSLPDQ